ncbi:MAG: helical backbone metal receptor [Fulvivirga sp.]
MHKQVVRDQMGFDVEAPIRPQAIVSLVPSQTELLFDLGLEKLIKGVTKFCIHPHDKVSGLPKIGGTKNFNFEAIDEINPDLIIGNKEENYQEGITKLKEKYPVWMSDISTVEGALEMIKQLGKVTGKTLEASTLSNAIESGFAGLQKKNPKRTLYLIWRNPYMVAGKETFIDEMLSHIGLENAAKENRYPELSPSEIKAFDPQLILLSSEPYPFKAKHFDEFTDLCPKADIRIVDGEMFSWYGSRLLKAPAYLNSLSF